MNSKVQIKIYMSYITNIERTLLYMHSGKHLHLDIIHSLHKHTTGENNHISNMSMYVFKSKAKLRRGISYCKT